MLKEQAKLFAKLMIFVDMLLIGIAFVAAYDVRSNYMSGEVKPVMNYAWVLIPALPASYYLLAKYKLYESIRRLSYFDIFYRVFCVNGIVAFIVSALVLFFDRDAYSRRLLLLFLVFSFLAILVDRFCLKRFLSFVRRRGLNYRELIVVGATTRAEDFIRLIEDHADWGLHTLGVVQIDSGELKDSVLNYKVLGRLTDLEHICKSHTVDEVVFCLGNDQVVDIEAYLQMLEELGVTVRVVLNFYNIDHYRRDISFFEGTIPILTYHAKTLDSQQLLLKRVIDIFGSAFGLLITVLLFPFIALAIKLEDPGPIFFCQERIGQSGRIFCIWKFRSMFLDAEKQKEELMAQNEKNGAIFKIKNDPRTTRVGRFLRKTSLDELPQFWNVFKGEMSLVGTRPPIADEVDQYENWHRRRFIIKPGITGLWQVNGRNSIDDFNEIVKLDLAYIDKWSIWLDVKILFKTIWVVLSRQDSY